MKTRNFKYEAIKPMSSEIAKQCDVSPEYVRLILRGLRATQSDKARNVIRIADQLLDSWEKTNQIQPK